MSALQFAKFTPKDLRRKVCDAYVNAGLIEPIKTGTNPQFATYRSIVEQYYRGPSATNGKSLAQWLLDNVEEIKKQKFAHDIGRRAEQFQSNIQQSIAELEQRRADIDRNLRELRQQEHEFREEQRKEFDAFPDWSNYDESPLKLPHHSSAYRQALKDIELLKEKPFGTEVVLGNLSEYEYREIGDRLNKWFNEFIVPRINERMMVVYRIRGLEKPKEFRVSAELDRLRRLFTENIAFQVSEDASGIASGDNATLCLEWLDSITFLNFENWIPRPNTRRSTHRDGFFPRKLSGNYRVMEPVLEQLQVYASYLNDSGKVKKSVNEPCFINSLRQANVDEAILSKIMSFVGFQKRISRNVWTEIANAFGLRIHLRFFDEKTQTITLANKANKGWYGREGNREIYLAEYMDHVFIDKDLQINLWSIRNWNRLCELVGLDNIDMEKLRHMLMARDFKDNCYQINRKRANARSLEVLVEINRNNGFELISASDIDVDKAQIHTNECIEPEPIAAPYNEKLHTRPIRYNKYSKNNMEIERPIFYADFETAQRRRTDVKNVSTEQVPFMLCVTNQSGTVERTYTGNDMQQQMMNDLPDQAIVYFHNLGFDGNFFFKFGSRELIKKGSKTMQMNVEYRGKKFTLKDSYSLFPKKLRDFPSSFPNAFVNSNVQKEFMPYNYYNYDRISKSVKGNILECILEEHLSIEDANQFSENIASIPGCLIDGDSGDFDMMRYCEFYCLQDIRVLRIGFEAYAESAAKEPININVHSILTVPSLANKYMQRNVFYPNGNVYELNGNVQKFCQAAVYGGRCMTAKNIRYKVKKTKLSDFDACALYSSAMARMFTVEGIPVFYENTDPSAVFSKNNLPMILKHAFDIDQLTPTEDKFISQFVVDIEIVEIGIEREFPLIVERTKERQANVNKCTKMRVDMIMLQDLIEFQEISFNLGNGYIWTGKRDHSIRKEIKKLFDLRAQYKKEKNPTQEIIKLIMNSAYGKSIQKPIKTFLQFVKKEEVDWFTRDRYYQIHCVYHLDDGNKLFELTKQKNNQFNNVLFGLTVLSMSKRIMNEVMCLAEDMNIKIYYQDTDSMHIEFDKVGALGDAFKAKYGRTLIDDATLGCFHNDFPLKDAYCTDHISLGKKMYCDKIRNDKGEEDVHFRMKGVPQQVVQNHADRHFNGDLWSLYEHIYNGNSINFNLLDGSTSMMCNLNGEVLCRAEFMREVRCTAPKNNE